MTSVRRLRRIARKGLMRVPIFGSRFDRAWRRRWLLRRMPPGSVCAEIGVWKGDFTAQILDVARPRRLHLIDPWRSSTDPGYAGVLYDKDQQHMDRIHESVLARFEAEIKNGTIVVHRAPSAEAAVEIPDESLDWVYIDGDHFYEGVKKDIALYSQKVRPGGFVCGDDYEVGGRFDSGVKRAVDEALQSGDLRAVAIRGGQFVAERRPSPQA